MARKKTIYKTSQIRALMKGAGAGIVSREAVDVLKSDLEDNTKKMSACAIKFSQHRKAKKVNLGDMNLARDYCH